MLDILNGIRVVTLAVNLPGPLAASRLSAMGASVVKVESPGGDPLAHGAPGWYAELLGEQLVAVLDLKDPSDLVKLDALLTGANVLITSMRPSALRRLGLGDATARFPGLSHVEIVGHDGELEELPGHDLTYQAAHGTLQPPLMPVIPAADLLGAERAVSAALLGLIGAAKTGVGQRYRVVLEDAAAAAGAAIRHGLVGEGALLGGATPTYGIYQTADGHIALGAPEPHFRSRTLEALGVADTHEALARVFAGASNAHWEELAAQVDIPIVGIRNVTRGEEEWLIEKL
ncbi:CoA transferase [Rhodococcus sp. ARC_M6]|uniref:CoA transferase n=1 Tax=Rhodococcus sp. ARC_M6 TaxID=2928852 RepID=UPI001FB20497|nr:CoA transferase [Rhodococcus sp. ARC_M6]MCJ0907282.1 CoA transferase [Rhodococcus sp. ARC_M6]